MHNSVYTLINVCVYNCHCFQTIMRMMDNCSVETDTVKMLQDDLNYYVESNQEPDFAENEMMYDDLEIEESSIYATSST